MGAQLKTPGVYRDETFIRTPAGIPSGVPGFVGFGSTASGGPELLYHVDQLAGRWTPPSDGKTYLDAAVAGFFGNGGARCYVVGAGDAAGGAAGLSNAVSALAGVAEIDLVATPDAMTLAPADAQLVQRAALVQCANLGDRFALLDGPPVSRAATDVAQTLTAWRDAVLAGSAAEPANAGLYFPWVWPVSALAPVPPCGHVAGIVARSDARVGVFKAPANEVLSGVVNLDFVVDDLTQGQLNPLGVNCLRALRGRGLRLYGARTLSSDPQWRYVNVRRLVLALVRWTEQNMAWATFEPNTPRLWIRIQRELNVYLERLWRAGGLQGASAAEAFFVKCDAETNPQETRDQGQVVTEIGLAPAVPAEFVVIHITQRAGATDLS